MGTNTKAMLEEMEAIHINTIRTNLMEIKDAIRFMSLGHQFKDFLDQKLSDALSELYNIQHPQ